MELIEVPKVWEGRWGFLSFIN